MKGYKYQLFILVVFFSCQDNSILTLPTPATKIVVNSLLMAHQSPKVYVGKTWAVTAPTPKTTYYDNAKVTLWENELLIGTLGFKNGFYELPSFVLKPQQSYQVRVEVPDVGKAESPWLMVPADINIQSITLDPTVKWITRDIPIQKPILAHIVIKNKFINDDYLVTSALTMKGNKKIEFHSQTVENGEISASSLTFNSNSCYALFPELSGIAYKRSIGYNSNCFSGEFKNIDLILDKMDYNSSEEATAIKIYVAVYSAEYLQYAKAAKAIEAANYAFIETKPTYSNIKGGIGFVTAINQKDTTITL